MTAFRRGRGIAALVAAVLLGGSGARAHASSCTVPVGPGCSTIQAALDQATAGDTITVAAGTYFEKLVVSQGGSAGGGFVTLQAAAPHTAVLDGTGVAGSDMIRIDSQSYVRIIGFEIRNHLNVNDGSGVRIIGSGSHLEIRNNKIHDIRGDDAMGITVYGTAATSISNLIIDGNQIYDCEPARSEALTLNGNVEQFEVTNNIVRDVNNIGIDFIGGETDIQPDPNKVARNGVCRGNQVYRARSVYEGGYAGAIYVDGGRDILIERNITSESDLGLEVGAENEGTVTRNIIVRDNLIYRNDKTGLVFGGYASDAGRVEDSQFLNNTLYQNDTLDTGNGQLWIQFAENNVVRNNIFVADHGTLLASWDGNLGNLLDYNLWFTTAAEPLFLWNGAAHIGLAAFQAATAQDSQGLFSDPLLVDPAHADFHLQSTSPAIDAGDPIFAPGVGETDIDGAARVSGGRLDIGADEASCGNGAVDPGEICDDGDLTDCDGCDSNCTLSASCGNSIRCGGEACDDGNSNDGDCCDATCNFEPAGSACDDSDLCSNQDQCDATGHCLGSATPEPVCKRPISIGRSQVQLLDRNPNERDQLKWKWSKGAQTDASEFGDPLASTGYSLCLYDSSVEQQPRLRTAVAPSILWSSRRNGYKFKDSRGSQDGVRSISVSAGDVGRARISVGGKGTNLPLAVLPFTLPVTVQLRNASGSCWGAVYNSASSNDPAQFKAKGE